MSDQEEINEESFRFTLTKPLSYSAKTGEQVEAGWIELHPPTPRVSRECSALKQAFMRAFHEAHKDEDDEVAAEVVEGDSSGPDGIYVVNIIAMSSVNLPDTLEIAKKLFTSGVAQVEGEVKLTNNLIEKMGQNDFERMVGDYLVHFTLASLWRQNARPSPNR